MGMKANKVHQVIKEGIVYIGFYMNRRKNGKAKVGTTENKLKTRVSNIRSKNGKDFYVVAYLVLKNTTKSRIEHVESGIKVMLEENYANVSNDHFTFRMENQAKAYADFARQAIDEAMRICNERRWSYEVRFVQEF